ncbi:hypothetical protein Ahy_B08g092438 [Arachis hypogaea]|uniref:Uncharacterized protein n=1 Tax=Arachis hypogaea TaxID=3818 RepID=A0A444Y3W8_ARAHY|nr:hypothetical protein Ahy_B08g092438 [Arachis hypogaea]
MIQYGKLESYSEQRMQLDVTIKISGLVSSGEIAREYAATGVGLLAGSSILLVTVVWEHVLSLAAKNFSIRMKILEYSLKVLTHHSQSGIDRSVPRFHLTPLIDRGITTDLETSYTAWIMIV